MKGLVDKTFRGAVLAALMSAGAAAGAIACEGQAGNVVFEDTFPDDSGGWEFTKDRTSVVPPEFLITLPQAESWGQSTQNLTFEASEGEFCVEFAFPQDTLPQDSYLGAGLVFWASDYDNYYLLETYSYGKVGLYRRSRGQWSTIFEVTDSGVVKPAPEVNALRAVAKGGRITTFVNGQEIKVVRAPLPESARRFGFYAESGKLDTPVAIRFRRYLVTDGG